jgi:hypothetical protein
MASSTANPARVVSSLVTEIRVEMVRRDLTIASAAAHFCVTPQTVGRKLNGHRTLTIEDVIGFADWLGLPASELLARAEAVTATKRPTSKRAA